MIRFLRLLALLAMPGLLFLAGCKPPGQNDPTIKVPAVGGVTVSEIKTTTAKVTSAIREVGFGVLGTSTIKEYGICQATKDKPTTADTKISLGSSTTATLDMVATLTGLTPGTGMPMPW